MMTARAIVSAAKPAEPGGSRPRAHEVDQGADGAEREKRVAHEEHGDMDEDPVALQGRNERLDLLVADQGSLPHGDEREGHGEDADDPQAPLPLDDQVAD